MDAIETENFKSYFNLLINTLVVVIFSYSIYYIYHFAISGQRDVPKIALFLIPSIGYFFIAMAVLNIIKNVKVILNNRKK